MDALKNSVVDLNIENVKRFARRALKERLPAYMAVMNGMAKGMEIVGKKYEKGEYYLSELVMAGEAMKEGMAILRPELKKSAARPVGKVVIGTVEGDLHDIGKNIVITMLMSAGFEVHDLGVDVSPNSFVRKTRKVRSKILAMSALLTTTFPHMKDVIDAVNKAGTHVKTIVGGASLNEEIAMMLGADAYGRNAIKGVEICKKWSQERSIADDTAHR